MRVGIAVAHAALPVLPEADGKNRDPEDVPDVESADRDGAAGSLAAEAVVVAESNLLRPEMVGAVDDEHGGSTGCLLTQDTVLRHRAGKDRQTE